MVKEWHKELENIYDDIVNWRRDFHQYPELSFQETLTANKVEELLTEFGLEVQTGVGGNGVIGTLKGTAGGKGKVIALRADFDALPIQDKKDVPYKSKVNGVMHACGHDGHTASLLGVARVLKKFQDQISGTVIFVFQHAEEKVPGGAVSIVKSGVIDSIDAIFGAHLSAKVPLGIVQSKPGAILAAADTFNVKIQGVSAHGSRPHEGIDAILIASQMINQLQQIVSRRINAFSQAVITVGKIHGGTAENIIAEEVNFSGTVRTLDSNLREFVKSEIEHLIETIAKAHHAQAEITYTYGYPSLVNHENEVAIVQSIVENEFPELTYREATPGLGGEDFAYYLLEKPGAFFFVGAEGENPDQFVPHHHPLFDFDERAMLHSGKLFLNIIHHYEKELKERDEYSKNDNSSDVIVSS